MIYISIIVDGFIYDMHAKECRLYKRQKNRFEDLSFAEKRKIVAVRIVVDSLSQWQNFALLPVAYQIAQRSKRQRHKDFHPGHPVNLSRHHCLLIYSINVLLGALSFPRVGSHYLLWRQCVGLVGGGGWRLKTDHLSVGLTGFGLCYL